MNRSPNAKSLVVGLSLFSLAGCASTTIRSVESDPIFNSNQIHRVLVINMAKDTALRMKVEDEFVQQWKEKNVDAVASYKILPPAMKIEKAPVAAAAKAQNFDTVLVTRLLETQKIDTQTRDDDFEVAISTDLAPGATEYTKAIVASPQYASNYRMAAVTTRIYQVPSEKRVWTGLSDTLVAENPSKLIKPFVKAVLKALYPGDN